jgi:hypothetical protein
MPTYHSLRQSVRRVDDAFNGNGYYGVWSGDLNMACSGGGAGTVLRDRAIVRTGGGTCDGGRPYFTVETRDSVTLEPSEPARDAKVTELSPED